MSPTRVQRPAGCCDHRPLAESERLAPGIHWNGPAATLWVSAWTFLDANGIEYVTTLRHLYGVSGKVLAEAVGETALRWLQCEYPDLFETVQLSGQTMIVDVCDHPEGKVVS